MRKNIFYIIGLVFALQICYFFWHPKPVKTENLELPKLSLKDLPDSMHGLNLKKGKFFDLFGWSKRHTNVTESFKAFLISCDAFLKHDPDDFVGSDYIQLYAKDWFPVCTAAQEVDKKSEKAVKSFFEHWFVPVEFAHKTSLKGLFTGYYIPIVAGSLHPSDKYSVPIYGVPNNLISASLRKFSNSLPSRKIVGRLTDKKLVPFYTREEIDKGKLGENAEILAYVESEIDRLIIETEGSGVINFADGERLVIGFAATNGGAYNSIASLLIKRKIMSPSEATMENIKHYFQKYPSELKEIINQNKSFVFFRKLPSAVIVGSQGVPLTGGYSMAVDRKWIPQGLPLWLTTSMFSPKHHTDRLFDRLMIAQDAGGSIKGMIRGDIYFGEGDKAKENALNMYSMGHYWLLLPRLDRAKDEEL